jgi:N-methylhydantoinase A/oxoprolinase/acetone carboxylase beta subunit
MGGTTTDIAFIQGGLPVTVTSGVSIGKWKTFVNGLYVKTFGLGGDSAVHYNEENLYLEEYRIVPLCVAAKKYPSVTENLRNMEPRRHTRFLYEHYMLIKDIEDSPRYTDAEKTFCRALAEKPLPIIQAAEAVGKDIYTLQIGRLLKDGVVQICGLTPTDMMHIRGDFNEYDAEASRLGAAFAAFNLGITVEELSSRVYDEVKKKLYINIVKAMLENKYPDYMKNGINADVERFIIANYEEIKAGKPDPLFSTMFRTGYSLVGAGAPICVFLEDVAAMLGTHAHIPENHHVANALGAVMGSVSAVCTLEIGPDDEMEGISGYVVFGAGGKTFFRDLEDAAAFAKEQVQQVAREEAAKRGAKGEISVTVQVEDNIARAKDMNVYLGTQVTARATGTMGF